MGDSKEAGAEAPPAGTTARGGLSLLPPGEAEEPSAQVSPRGVTAGRSAGEGCHGSRRPLALSPRLPGSPLKRGLSLYACRPVSRYCKSFVSEATLVALVTPWETDR